MSALIETLEKATEGGVALNCAILKALRPDLTVCDEPGRDDFGCWVKIGDGIEFAAVPEFTRSLDAALMLVPEGWHWTIEGPDPLGVVKPYCLLGLPGQKEADGRAATAPLAVAAAALRARQS